VGPPLDTCMLDVRFREKFQDALAVVISDEERAGLDILTHGDFHCDEDMAGARWHHYPLQRWAGFEGDPLQSEETRSPWLRYPPGTLLNEIYTGWRWPRVVDKIEHRPLDYPKIWRIAQASASARALRHLLLAGDGPVPRHPHAEVQGQARVSWDMAVAMNTELLALRDAGCRCIQIEEPTLHFMANTYGARTRGEVHGRVLQPRGAGARRRGDLDSHLLGQPEHAAGDGGHQLPPSFELYLHALRGDVWTMEMTDRDFARDRMFGGMKGPAYEEDRGRSRSAIVRCKCATGPRTWRRASAARSSHHAPEPDDASSGLRLAPPGPCPPTHPNPPPPRTSAFFNEHACTRIEQAASSRAAPGASWGAQSRDERARATSAAEPAGS
jgi:hypothetical protein